MKVGKGKMKVFDLFGRAYMYFKLGWANYLALILGLVAYFTIIYNFILYKYVPANSYTYGLIGIGLVAVSVLVGIVSKRSGFWGREHQVSTEANPVLNYPIGDKEVLAYDSAIVSLENSIEVNKKLGIPADRLFYLLTRTKEMRSRANVPSHPLPNEREEEERLAGWTRDTMLDMQLFYQKIKPHTAFLDLGASIGDTAIAFASNPNVESVYAFEAIPYTYEEAIRNIKRQSISLRNKIHLYNIAIGGEDKIIRLEHGINENSENTTTTHLSDTGVEVAQKSLPTLLKEFRNVALKIDIEGSEFEAIRPGIDLSNVYLAQIETHSNTPGTSAHLLNIFIRSGFIVIEAREKPQPLYTESKYYLVINEANYHG